MCLLNIEEIKLIEEEVQYAHISYSHLEYDLVDHICCDVERRMEDGCSFKDAFAKVKEEIGGRGLKQIQQETLLLIDKNYRIMKKSMKILGVVALALMAMAALFKIQHWPMAGVMLTLSFLIINFFFFPSAMYVVYKEMYNKKKAGFIITGTIGGILFMTGVLFKVQHWPVAGILISIGALLLAVFLLQSAVVSKIKKTHPVYVVGILSTVLYVLGFLFKIQHWPGASIMISCSTIILAVIFLPWLAIKNYKESKIITREFIFTVCALMYFMLFGFMLALNTSKIIMNDFLPIGKNFSVITSFMEDKSNEIYSLEEKPGDVHAGVDKIKTKADELVVYIEDIKVKSLVHFEEISEKDALNLIENQYMIQNKSAHIGEFMFRGGSSSFASSLKQKIDEYHSVLTKFIEDEKEKELISQIFDTRTVTYRNEYKKTWEEKQFGSTVLLAFFNNMSALQYKVRLTENETVKNLCKISQVSNPKSK